MTKVTTATNKISQKTSYVPPGTSKAGTVKMKKQPKTSLVDEFSVPISGNSSVLQHKRDSIKQSREHLVIAEEDKDLVD